MAAGPVVLPSKTQPAQCLTPTMQTPTTKCLISTTFT